MATVARTRGLAHPEFACDLPKAYARLAHCLKRLVPPQQRELTLAEME